MEPSTESLYKREHRGVRPSFGSNREGAEITRAHCVVVPSPSCPFPFWPATPDSEVLGPADGRILGW